MIDYLRYGLTMRTKKMDLFGFVADQFLHLGAIVFLWQMFDLEPEPVMGRFYASFFSFKTLTVFQQSFSKLTINVNHLLIISIVVFYTCFGGGIFIRKFLQMMNKGTDTLETDIASCLRNTGYYIGMIERLLILTLVFNNALSGTAFVFTAKSIARFSELNSKEFAEYYLIGTLASTTLAIISGFLLKFLLESI